MSVNKNMNFRGWLLFVVLVCIIALIFALLKRYRNEKNNAFALSSKDIKEIKNFETQLRQDSLHRAIRFHSIAKEPRAKLFKFNPNTADSMTFLKLGLKPYQVRIALNYRRKGGIWRKPEDFAHLYTLRKEQFECLLPYIQIDITKLRRELFTEKRNKEFVFMEKLKSGETIDCNTADTTSFKKIPGIGSYYAQKICHYRKRLGGFYALSQIKEITGLPPHATDFMSLSASPKCNTLSINKSDFKTLLKHPYLNLQQVKIIFQHRRLKGNITSWKELLFYPEFTEKDVQRLEHYFTF